MITENEEIKAATIVWTGGIRGNHLIEEAGFDAKRGRVQVDPHLRSMERDNVFVVGDCSIFMNEEGRPYPPTAQIAIQQGEAVAYNLVAAIRGEKLKAFAPSIKGTVASLGKKRCCWHCWFLQDKRSDCCDHEEID